MRLYGQILKVTPEDDGTVRVEGIASSESIDDQGEIVRADAMRQAIPEYMRFPALREMHQLSAAGTTIEAVVDEEDGVTRIVARVVDPIAISKVKNQVYRGFSIGGRVTKRDADNPKIITGIQLNEISLVDRPANPEAVMECWKASLNQIEGSDMTPGLATIGDTPAGEKLAALNPVQIWACDHPDHRHVAKAAAVQCLTQTAQGDVDAAKAALAEAGAETAEETSDETAETDETSQEVIGEEEAESSEEVEKGAEADASEVGEAEADPAEADTAEIEKRTQEGVSEAQAVIDAALKAVERGELVLAEPSAEEGGGEAEATEKAAEAEESAAEEVGVTENDEAGAEEFAAAFAEKSAKSETPAETPAETSVEEEPVEKADDSKKPYGDVEYADNGLQADGKKRYPIDTEAHIRAAWNYINKPNNCAKYGDSCAKVKAKIVAAWKAKIDKDGPPSAKKAADIAGLAKSIDDLGSIASVIAYLDGLSERLAYERAIEGDDSTAPEQAEAACAAVCALLRNIATEETAEIMSDSEADMGDAEDNVIIMMSATAESLRKAGMNDLAEPFEKAGAKHSARDQMLLDVAYTCCTKAAAMGGCTAAQKASFNDAKECIGSCGGKETAAKSSEALVFTIAMDRLVKGGGHQALADMAHDAISRVTKGAACSMGKAGARHSKETMEHLGKAHGHLCAAGATCDNVKKDDDMSYDAAAADGDIIKALETERAEKAAVTAENAALVKALGQIVPMLDRLTQRVEDIAQAPLPAQAVARVPGGMSVSKSQDGRDPDNSAAPLLTAEEIIKALPAEERPMAAMRLAHQKPMDFSQRFRARAG